MDCFDELVRDWTKSLTSAEKESLAGDGTKIFLGLRQLKLEIDFLDACLAFWDPAYHVFRFPRGEVSPLLEEFAAVAGWSARTTPVVVRLETGSRGRVQNYLSMTRDQCDDLKVGTKLNMLRLCQRFMNRGGYYHHCCC